MPQNEQTSLEQAFLDFTNLKEATKAELMGQLEDKVEDKLLSLMNEMDSTDQGTIKEGVKVTVDIDGDDISVDTDQGEAEDFETIDSPEGDAEEEGMFEVTSDAESFEITQEMENHLEEQDPMAMPAPEAAPEAPMAPEAAPVAPEAAPAADLNSMSPEELLAYAVEKVAVGGGAAPEAAGDEIDIVDDAGEMDPAMDPAMDPGMEPVAPVAEAEDEVFEIVDGISDDEFDTDQALGHIDKNITWDDVMGEDDELYEITLDLDEDQEAEGDEDLEEMKMMGHSHSAQRTQGTSPGPEVAVKNRSRKGAVKESVAKTGTAQYEANIAELNKENESLKAKVNEQTAEIKKFHNSFVELRSQFNEMQTFNAKLAYANKLFAGGGFSQKDKLKIAESFDKVGTADDAKKLYNSIISENKLSVNNVKSEIAAGGTGFQENVSKAAKPKNIKPSQHNVLYESDEMRRMRQLAGIRNLNS